MTSRRGFLQGAMAGLAGLAVGPARASAAEAQRRILPPGSLATTLAAENPARLDIRNLEVTPITRFGTMGQTMHETDIDAYRLTVDGLVDRPLSLCHAELLARPPLNRRVLLICPGVFSFLADWQGISLRGLLDEAGVRAEARTVLLHGPRDLWERNQKFPLDDIREEKIFLAHGVNGHPLPEAHGFPWRAVAEDRYGSEWLKYLLRIELT